MKHPIIAALAASLALAAVDASAAPPDALRPSRISGPGLNVKDLDGMKAWYADKLGMTLVRSYDRNGAVFEHIMGYPGGGAILALLKSDRRPEGRNGFSRMILEVPDPKGLAAHLTAQGVTAAEVIPSVAYFINDPEGNPIELYTPPKAPPKP